MRLYAHCIDICLRHAANRPDLANLRGALRGLQFSIRITVRPRAGDFHLSLPWRVACVGCTRVRTNAGSQPMLGHSEILIMVTEVGFIMVLDAVMPDEQLT